MKCARSLDFARDDRVEDEITRSLDFARDDRVEDEITRSLDFARDDRVEDEITRSLDYARDDSSLRMLQQNWAGLTGLQRAIPFVTPILFVFVGIKRAIDCVAAARTISGGGIGAEEVPGLLISSVFGFGAMRGEEDLVLPSPNHKIGRSGDAA